MSQYQDILDSDLNTMEVKLVPATSGKRFTNYIIDMIFFYLFSFIFAICITYFNENVLLGYNSPGLDYLINALLIVIYYTLIEHSLKGKTIGKYITKTRAVNNDGSLPNLKTFVLRSLSRVVPFDAFSFLGETASGWHDKWTNTMVIDETLSEY